MVSYAGATLASPTQLFADHQGSIVALANWSGVATAINSFDEYGIPAATNSGRFQYTGQIWLPELGMYHYKARVYSPTLGRFLQTDPIGYEGGFNLYGYVGNDPLNLTDPDGKNPAIDRRVAGLNSLSPDERLEALGYILGAASIWLPGPEDVVIGAWLARSTWRGIAGRGSSTTARVAGPVNRVAATMRRAQSLERGARTKLRNAAEHERRADAFVQNPTVRPGMEKMSPQDIARQQQERIDHCVEKPGNFGSRRPRI